MVQVPDTDLPTATGGLVSSVGAAEDNGAAHNFTPANMSAPNQQPQPPATTPRLVTASPQVVTVPLGQLQAAQGLGGTPVVAVGAGAAAVAPAPSPAPSNGTTVVPDRPPKIESAASSTGRSTPAPPQATPAGGGGASGGGTPSTKQQQQERARQEKMERDRLEKERASQHDQENKSDDKQILNREKLAELVKDVDPMQQLDEEVEAVLFQMADDFIEGIVASSCLMAKHRKSQQLEAKDVSVVLERHHNLYIPGFGGDELHTYKKTTTSEAHKQRLALIRKTLKKF